MQLIVDGRNSNTALLILGYANTIITDFSHAWMRDHGGPKPPAVLDIRARYNPPLNSQWFIVPGIVALLTQVVTLLVVALDGRARARGRHLRPASRHADAARSTSCWAKGCRVC